MPAIRLAPRARSSISRRELLHVTEGFGGTALDPWLWRVPIWVNPAQVSITGGRLRLGCTADYTEVRSAPVAGINFVDSSVALEIVTLPEALFGVETYFGYKLEDQAAENPTTEGDVYWLIQGAGPTVQAMWSAPNGGGATTVSVSFTYDSAVHKFFRIREASGTVFWDWSTDGVSWTEHGSWPGRTAYLPPSQTQLWIGTGHYAAGVPSTPAFAEFDNVTLRANLLQV